MFFTVIKHGFLTNQNVHRVLSILQSTVGKKMRLYILPQCLAILGTKKAIFCNIYPCSKNIEHSNFE